MGANIKIETLGDALAKGYHLKISCPVCGRSGIYGIRGVLDHFRSGHRARNTNLQVAGTYMRCDPDYGGCGHRGAKLKLVAPYRAPDLPPLKPSAYELRRRADRERG
jgi:hypothetical protein